MKHTPKSPESIVLDKITVGVQLALGDNYRAHSFFMGPFRDEPLRAYVAIERRDSYPMDKDASWKHEPAIPMHGLKDEYIERAIAWIIKLGKAGFPEAFKSTE